MTILWEFDEKLNKLALMERSPGLGSGTLVQIRFRREGTNWDYSSLIQTAFDLRLTRAASNTNGSAPLPFVIPSEAEGSAVLSTSIKYKWKRLPSLCHPERSRGICSSLHQHQIQMEAPPFPLSSRAKPRDLQFSPPASNPNGSANPPLLKALFPRAQNRQPDVGQALLNGIS